MQQENSWAQWIIQSISPNGCILDPHLRHKLKFQYHYAAFVLGQAVREEQLFPSALDKRVLQYLVSIPVEQKRVSNEFNAFLLTLAWLYLESKSDSIPTEASDILLLGIDRHPVSSPEELLEKNNNFTAMSFFVLDTWYRRGKQTDNKTRQLLRHRFQQFQYEDGFFYDTTCRTNGGIPSLVYHAKMSAIALLQGVFNHDDEFFERGKRGIDALLSLCPIERSMAYGRSQNSLFGFANYYLALQILARTLGQKKYRAGVKQFHVLFDSLKNPDGEHGINLRNQNRQRDGFDAYMYPIVYNIYAWALRLFADALTPIPRPNIVEADMPKSQHLPKLRYFDNSGFVSVRQKSYCLYLNTKSHATCSQYIFDPRYETSVPIVVYKKGQLLVPSIPAMSKPALFFGDVSFKSHLRRRIFGIRNKIQRVLFAYPPDHAGFLPFFVNPRFYLLTIEPNEHKIQNNRLEAVSPLRMVTRSFKRLKHIKFSSLPVVGNVYYFMKFDETGIDFETHTSLDKSIRGRLYHLNLRLPDVIFRRDSQDPIWFCAESGIRWKHTPQPTSVHWHRIPGSDAPVCYARAWISGEHNKELKTHTRLEFTKI